MNRSNAARPIGAKIGDEAGQSTGLDCRAYVGHQGEVIVEIVNRREPCAEDLVRALQMMQVSTREFPARVARASGIDRRRVDFVARIADLEIAVAGEQPSI